MRWLTAGESHGPELIAMLEGMPAGVPVLAEDIEADLARRRLGYGRGARMKFEADQLSIVAGVLRGETIGSPIALRIGNTEWPKWEAIMSAAPLADLSILESGRGQALTRPRPGHADLAGMQKYGFTEARPVLERASARETAARVALGAVAKDFLKTIGVALVSHTVSIAEVISTGRPAKPDDLVAIDADPMRCLDAATSKRMVERVDAAHDAGDTLGGVVEVLAYGMPPGVGSYVHWDRRLDSRLAGALMGIQAIKSAEVGDGLETTRVPGSAAHDEIEPTSDGIERMSHHAGGIEGGMSTGDPIRVRAGMKPIATVPHALRTVDIATGEPTKAHHQRSDVCAVPAAGVVAEAMVALVLADAITEKFGGDSVAEVKRNIAGYLDAIPEHLRTTSRLK